MLRATHWFCLLCVLVLSPAAGFAAECEDISYPDSIDVGGHSLTLNGLGVREATALSVNVYVAALYLENSSSNGNDIASSAQVKRLVLTFVRDVDADDIQEAWAEGFGHNAGTLLSTLMGDLEQLNTWMADMEEGDTMVFTYTPGSGLEVEVDGRSKGTIAGEDFQRIFFLIWLGSSPPNEGLKSGLLGGDCG